MLKLGNQVPSTGIALHIFLFFPYILYQVVFKFARTALNEPITVETVTVLQCGNENRFTKGRYIVTRTYLLYEQLTVAPWGHGTRESAVAQKAWFVSAPPSS